MIEVMQLSRDFGSRRVLDQVSFRVLPVLPGSQVGTDTTLTAEDEERMAAVWDEIRDLLYLPDENIAPLVPSDLGL